MDAEPKQMTREQFEAHWNHGDIRQAVERGRLSIECHEGQDWNPHQCGGWKMTNLDWLQDDLELYGNTEAEAEAARAHRRDLLDAWGVADSGNPPADKEN